ncbi:unnamed protein product, partial [Mesorhabditis spiculigera]
MDVRNQRVFLARTGTAVVAGRDEDAFRTYQGRHSIASYEKPFWQKPIFSYGILAVSILFLIAGAVMLGVGIHNNNKEQKQVTVPVPGTCPTPPAPAVINPFYSTLDFTDINYDDVKNDYEGSAASIRTRILGQMAMISGDYDLGVFPTSNLKVNILGISEAKQGVNVITALIFPIDISGFEVQKKLESMKNVVVNQVTGDNIPSSNNTQLCMVVNDFQDLLTTTLPTTTTTTPSPATGTTPTGLYGTYLILFISGATTPQIPTQCPTFPTQGPATTTYPVNPNVRDLVLLIDSSTALQQAVFLKLKPFLYKTLAPKLTIGNDTLLAAVGEYDDHHFNMYDLFDAQTAGELANVIGFYMNYEGKYGPSIYNALKRVNILHSAGRNAPRTVLMVTASSDPSDVAKSIQQANLLKSQGDYIVMLGVGAGVNPDILTILATAPNYVFTSKDLSEGDTLATSLISAIYGNTVPVTTAAPPTPPYTCNPDIAILFDASTAVGSEDEMGKQVGFFTGRVIPTWTVSPNSTEAAGAIYTNGYAFVVPGAYGYSTTQAFIDDLNSYGDDYYGGNPNITNGLSLLRFLSLTSRGNYQTAILVTYSSDYNDVKAAIPIAQAWDGNLIILGIGSNVDGDLLGVLTGNVITKLAYDDDAAYQINGMVCTKRPPHGLSTTSPGTVATSTITTTTTKAPFTEAPTTTVTPTAAPCPDCKPDRSSLLVVYDISIALLPTDFANVLKFLSADLFGKWNHWERVALAGFGDNAHFIDLANYRDITSQNDASILVNSQGRIASKPDVAAALHHAVQRYTPLAGYGIQHTIFFTSTANNIVAAHPYADALRALGTLTVVGINWSDMTPFVPLATTGSTVPWPDTTNTTGLSDAIDATLVAPPTTTPGPTTTTTGGTTTAIPTSSVQPTGPCQRAVILLIDESLKVPGAQFNDYKQFLYTLTGSWLFSRDQFSVAAIAYTKSIITEIATFDLKSADELKALIDADVTWHSTSPAGMTKVLKTAVGLKVPLMEGVTTILVTASSDPDDINSAIPYANQLKQNGNTVITVSMDADASPLSSGLDFAFELDTFDAFDVAQQINAVICKNGPAPPTTTTPTTQAPTTTTQPLPFPCQPDIALLIDGSGAVEGGADGVRKVSNFIVDPLSRNWPIMLNHTEASIYFYSRQGNLVLGGKTYEYVDLQEFHQALINHGDIYYGGDPSINEGIKFMLNHEHWQRGQPHVLLLFTWSSVYTDIAAAVNQINQIQTGSNVIVVGLGNNVNADYLAALSPRILWGALDQSLADQINDLICQGNTSPGTLPPTNPPTTTPLTTTTTTTAFAPPTTTVNPVPCPDCVPALANLVVVIDASGSTKDTFNDEILAVITMLNGWNHFERVALATFGDTDAHYEILAQFGDLRNVGDVNATLSSAVVQRYAGAGSLTSAFKKTLRAFEPNSKYGYEKTIIFTGTATTLDINTASVYAQALMARGQVVVIGVGQADVSAFQPLATPGDALAWPTTSDLNITNTITGILNSSIPTTTPGPTTLPPTTSATTLPSTPSTLPAATTTSPSSAACQRAVVLLIDVSNAIPSDSYDGLKEFTRQLVVSWSVGPSGYNVAGFGFTGQSLELIADFDLTSTQEWLNLVEDKVNYRPAQHGGVYRVMHAVASLDFPKNVSVTTILLTAYSNSDDLNRSIPFAYQLKQNGNSLITVSFGGADASILSSGDGFNFRTDDYKGNQYVAAVNQKICAQGPPPPVTMPPTTTTAAPTTVPSQFVCNPDIAIGIDSSSAVGSMAVFGNLIDFVAYKLGSTWPINRNETEAAAILYTNTTAFNVYNTFNYAHASDFTIEVARHNYDYYGTPPGMHQAILQTMRLSNRRLTQPKVLVLFTYSSGYSDAATSIDTLDLIDQQLGGMNLIIVALGDQNQINTDNLQAMSPRVLTGSLDDSMVSMINNMICQGNTKHAKIIPYCPDCIPRASSLLVVLDAATGGSLDQQKFVAKKLAAQWNHFERVALAAFGDTDKHYEVVAQYRDMKNSDTFAAFVDTIYAVNGAPSLTLAYKRTDNSFAPSSEWGDQQVVIFLTQTSADDVRTAAPYADKLFAKGSVIVVVIGSNDVAQVEPLASPNSAIGWADVKDTDTIVGQIEKLLDPNPVTRGPTTTGPSSLAPSSTKPSSAVPTSSGPTPTGTTTAPAPFCPDCNPPTANLLLLLENSGALTNDVFQAQLAVALTVVQGWNHFERVSIGSVATTFNQNAEYGTLNKLDDAYVTIKSIAQLPKPDVNLNATLAQVLKLAKPLADFEYQRVILFTTQTDVNDIVAAATTAGILRSMGSVTIVGIGVEAVAIYNDLATPHDAISWTNYQDHATVARQIDVTLGEQFGSTSAAPPAGSTTVSSPATTTFTTIPTIPTSQGPTTSGPFCADCNPPRSNLFVIFDRSATISAADYLQEQGAVLTLASTWNHYERVALGAYDSSFNLVAYYYDITSISDVHTYLTGVQQSPGTRPDLAAALETALKQVTPIADFGPQKTTLFISVTDPAEIARATPAAQKLQALGSLTVVGLNMATTDSFKALASPGGAIAWQNTSDVNAVVYDIDNTLGELPTTTSDPTLGSTTNLPSVAPGKCKKDILLMIDTSSSMNGVTNFNLVKNWVRNTLVPQWDLSSFTLAIATYSNKINMIMHFGDSASQAEVQQLIDQAQYIGNGYALDKSLHEALGLFPNTLMTTVIITANGDIGKARQYANQLKQGGNTISVLALEDVRTDDLEMISSGLGFLFQDNPTLLGDKVAGLLTTSLCLPAPTTPAPPTTPSTVPTTAFPEQFTCDPDIMLLLDCSNAGNAEQFTRMISFVANWLAPTWDVNMNKTNAEILHYCDGQTALGHGFFNFNSTDQLVSELMGDVRFYEPHCEPAMDDGLFFGDLFADDGRRNHPMTMMMFTFTSTYSQVARALKAAQPERFIIVAMEENPSVPNLQALTENVIVAGPTDNWNANLAAAINSVICNEKPGRETLPPTIPSTTSAASTTTTPKVTFAPPATTTISTFCDNCTPKGNILFILDAGSGNETLYAQFSLVVQLSNNINHPERIAVGAYRDTLANFQIPVEYKELVSIAELYKLLTLTAFGAATDLSTGFRKADLAFEPSAFYGNQQVIVFTTKDDATAIQKSQAASKSLKDKGNVILVGTGLSTLSDGLASLASSQEALTWPDLTQTKNIEATILGLLQNPPTSPTTSPGPTTSPVLTTVPSTQPSSTGTNSPTPPDPTKFGCHVDFAILFDNSDATGSADNMQWTVDFLSDLLIGPWDIGVNSQAEIIFYTKRHSLLEPNAWNYDSTEAVQKNFTSFDRVYFGGPPSMTAGLQSLLGSLDSRTTNDRMLTALMFTNSSGYDDIKSAIGVRQEIEAKLGVDLFNLILIGNSKDLNGDWMRALSGRVINAESFNDVLCRWLNDHACLRADPPVTLAPLPTLSTAQVPTTTTPFAPPTTIAPTVTPITCNNCTPEIANILIILDATSKDLEYQANLVTKLTANWWPWARVALGAFSDIFQEIALFGEIRTADEFALELSQINPRLGKTPNLANGFKQSFNQFTPNANYGIERLIILTGTESGVAAAAPYADAFMARGTVTLVGVDMDDITNLAPLASPGFAIPWPNPEKDDMDLFAGLINRTLYGPTPTGVPSAATTTLRPTTVTPPVTGSTTSNPPVPTTANPCPDCNPPTSSILFVLDQSKNNNGFAQMKDVVLKLAQQMNRFERIAIATYSKTLVSVAQYGDLRRIEDLAADLESIYQDAKAENMTSAIQACLSNDFKPVAPFTTQHTIFFTASGSNDDAAQATTFAQQLGAMGTLTPISIVTHLVSLDQLAFPKSYAIYWDELTKGDAVVETLKQQLGIVPSTSTSAQPTLPTVTPPIGTTTTPVVASTSTMLTVAPTVDPCPDCNPPTSSILFVLDQSKNNNGFAHMKSLVLRLAQQMNHFERIAVAAYSKTLVSVAQYGDLRRIDDLMADMEAVYQDARTENMTSALQGCLSNDYKPVSPFTVQHTIFFTASTSNEDATQAVAFAQQLGAMGTLTPISVVSHLDSLNQLAFPTSYAIYWDDLTNEDDVLATLNQQLGIVTSISTIAPTTSPTVTAPVGTTTMTAAGSTSTKWTVAPTVDPCPDCNPATSSILFVIDQSSNNKGFDQMKDVVVKLAQQMNHPERIAIASYSKTLVVVAQYGDLRKIEDVAADLASVYIDKRPENMTTAIKGCLDLDFKPVASFTTQHTIFFTASTNNDDVNQAQESARTLGMMGSLTPISVINTLEELSHLAYPPQNAIYWDDITTGDQVVDVLMRQLGMPPRSTTTGTTAPTTTPGFCPDCVPSAENVLFLFDTSALNKNILATQSAVRELVTGWNHFERVAFGEFGSILLTKAGYGEVVDLEKAYELVDDLDTITGDVNLTYALIMADKVYKPKTEYGIQRTVVLTQANSILDIESALPAAQTLQAKGSLTIVALPGGAHQLADLASPNMYFNWLGQELDPLFCGILSFLKTNLGDPSVSPTCGTPAPDCADCVPGSENILLLFDTSEGNYMFSDMQAAIRNATSTWNHFERVAIGEYSNLLLTQAIYGELEGYSDFLYRIDDLNRLTGQANMATALEKAAETYQPLLEFNKLDLQRTILFTSTSIGVDDALVPAAALKQLGLVAVVGLGVDAAPLQPLASAPDLALSWQGDQQALVSFIQQALERTHTTTAASTTQSTTTTSAQATTSGFVCNECYPQAENILFLIDGSTRTEFFGYIQDILRYLAADFNHCERIAMGAYDSTIYSHLNFNEEDCTRFGDWMDDLDYGGDVRNLTVALESLFDATVFNPVSKFGPTRVVIFTGATEAETTLALPSAQKVKDQGTLTIVGLETSIDIIQPLASPGFAYAWTDVDKFAQVKAFVVKTLTDPAPGPATTGSPIATTPGFVCDDCYPQAENILILMDGSYKNQLFGYTEGILMSLSEEFNHCERMAMGAFAFSIYGHVDFNGEDCPAFLGWLDNLDYGGDEGNLTAALQSVFDRKYFNPPAKFGQIRVVVFTNATKDDVTLALPSAEKIKAQGTLTIIGLGTPLQLIQPLATPGFAYSWSDHTKAGEVKAFIIDTLNNPNPGVTTSSAATSQKPTTPGFVCDDCYPQPENILFLMDGSKKTEFFGYIEELLMKFPEEFNHCERIAMGAYDSKIYGHVDFNRDDCLRFDQWIDNLDYGGEEANLTTALESLFDPKVFNPLSKFGPARVVIFTKPTQADVTAALPSAEKIKAQGTLTIIALGTPVEVVQPLATPGFAYSWTDGDKAELVKAFVIKTLTDPAPGATTTTSPATTAYHCDDCNPAQANILFVFDVSYIARKVRSQVELAKYLAVNWNYLERVALAEYSSDLSILAEYGQMTLYEDFLEALSYIKPSQDPENMTRALEKDATTLPPNFKQLQALGEVAVVGLGLGLEDAEKLQMLGNYVYAWKNLDDVMAVGRWIDALLGGTLPTQSPATSGSTSGPTTPFRCDDCNPESSSILVIVDRSLANPGFAQQMAMLKELTSDWTHWERIALMDYGPSANLAADFGDLHSYDDFTHLLDLTPAYGEHENITNALRAANSTPIFDPKFGEMKVLFFSASNDAADVKASRPYGESLHRLGEVVVVGIDLVEEELRPFYVYVNYAIPWTYLDDFSYVMETIDHALSGSEPTTTKGTGPTTTKYLCSDCNPTSSSILIIIDEGAREDAFKLTQAGLTLVAANWNHFERVAIISALKYAAEKVEPVPRFGEQQTLLFTTSNNRADVASAKPYAEALYGRLIVVALGMDISQADVFAEIADEIVAETDLNDIEGLAADLDDVLRGHLPTTTAVPTTSKATRPSTATATANTATTTFTNRCPDCNPPGNLLLLFDTSAQNSAFIKQMEAVEGVGSRWNHFERVALAGYNNVTFSTTQYGDLQSLDDFDNKIGWIARMSGTSPNLTLALSQALSTFQPDSSYGQQHVILFTETNNNGDIADAIQAAKELKKLGPLTVVAYYPASELYEYLASPDMYIQWTGETVGDIVDAVEKTLGYQGPSTPAGMTTEPTTASSSTSNGAFTTIQTAPPSTTTTVPVCPDCYPSAGDILLVLDESLSDKPFPTFFFTLFMKLTNSWNHYERVGVVGYSTGDADYQVHVDYGKLRNQDQLLTLVSELQPHGDRTNLTSAFQNTALKFSPTSPYHNQKVVVFTSTTNITDPQSTGFYAKILQSLGSVTLVGVQVDQPRWTLLVGGYTGRLAVRRGGLQSRKITKKGSDIRRSPTHDDTAKCGTAEKNYQPCTTKKIANKLFRSCCELYVPDECHFMCEYETDQMKTRKMLIDMVKHKRCSIKYLSSILYCASQNRDNRKCCEDLDLNAPQLQNCPKQQQIICAHSIQRQGVCVCNEGLYRARNGNCVLQGLCPLGRPGHGK